MTELSSIFTSSCEYSPQGSNIESTLVPLLTIMFLLAHKSHPSLKKKKQTQSPNPKQTNKNNEKNIISIESYKVALLKLLPKYCVNTTILENN